jgi:hypothetical protein
MRICVLLFCLLITNYLASMRTLLPQGVPPMLDLRSPLVVIDASISETIVSSIHQALHGGSVFSVSGSFTDATTRDTYEEQPDRSALIIVHPKNLDRLKRAKIISPKTFNTLSRAARKTSSLWIQSRDQSHTTYVIIAADSTKALRAFETLLTQPPVNNGLLPLQKLSTP